MTTEKTKSDQTELPKQLYSAPPAKSATHSLDSATRRRTVMIALWKRLREYLGLSWTREHGEIDGSDIDTWQDALAEFSEAQIARGVKWCQSWDRDFPPTLPQFKKLCLTVRPEELPNHTERRLALEKQTGQSVAVLEHLARSATSEIAKRELNRMSRVLAGEHVESFDRSYHNCELGKRWPGGRVEGV